MSIFREKWQKNRRVYLKVGALVIVALVGFCSVFYRSGYSLGPSLGLGLAAFLLVLVFIPLLCSFGVWLVRFARTDCKLPGWFNWLAGALPFVLLAWMWMYGANYLRYMEEHFPDAEVASSKLMPLPEEMLDGLERSLDFEKPADRLKQAEKRAAAVPEDVPWAGVQAVVEDKMEAVENSRLVLDSVASFQRFGIGLGIVALGVIVGLYMGTFPVLEALFYRFFIFADKVPPLLILPVLVIVLGVGEESKIALIVLGVMPGVILDAYNRTKEIPIQQIHKAHTLGASESEIVWRILFPQILPKMLASLRSNFKAAWSYVVAGETISAFYGIGFRVYLLKRNASMDVIIPYVLLATAFMFLLDYIFQWLERKCPGEEGGK